ncbi:MAG: YlbF family regulator [Dethiobacteria bacterium]|jgi:cell fate (sporulation/competence/biofilm development) regulator YlbF (YheA/YmcA/DUF963 family)|nr:hypothetical protein [Bacillota bacterium]
MNIYDKAHSLAAAIKKSNEYREFLAKKNKLKENKKALEMLKDLRKAQFELQKQKLSGNVVSSEQEEKVKRLAEIANMNNFIREYLEAEYRFMVMIQDIQKILGGAMKEAEEALLQTEGDKNDA